MSDFELLSIVLMILSIVITILIAYIKKKLIQYPLGSCINSFYFTLLLSESVPAYTSSIRTSIAASPLRWPILTILV